MKCARCGTDTPRMTRDQTRCPKCEQEVNTIIAADERRRAHRIGNAKDFTRTVAL